MEEQKKNTPKSMIDLSSVTNEKTRDLIRKLPKDEKQRRFKEQLCLHCAQKGHLVNDCPNPFVRA